MGEFEHHERNQFHRDGADKSGAFWQRRANLGARPELPDRPSPVRICRNRQHHIRAATSYGNGNFNLTGSDVAALCARCDAVLRHHVEAGNSRVFSECEG